MNDKLLDTVFKAVAVAMGVAAVVLGILHAATPETTTILLGIGLFALAITSLR
jgi:hypothetical protein